MKEESQEIRWNGSEWEGMLEEVFKMVATTLPTDLTLVTEDGEMLEAHSIILKASSPFFRSILDKSRPGGNKNVIIYMPGFSHQQLVLVVEFVYSGGTTVPLCLMLETFSTNLLPPQTGWDAFDQKQTNL